MTTPPDNGETRHPCYTETTKTNPILTLKTSGGDRYMLPNYHFLGGKYDQDPETEQWTIVLDFPLHTTRIKGSNLTPIIRAIRHMQANFISALTEPPPESEPHVTSIEVAYKHDQ